ncbi:hypothetical protein KUV73_25005 [Mameliella alba]|nr:hypothetical protein [Mameliella alba]MBY6172663.1 hypothetical protein [Mameliella alba]MBY6177645.1 hypothetical protein [Mameliella alba]
MFTLTPIGSCRITAPLRLGEAAHGVRLNLSRCYGYCHSPAEAVQMARFMRGDITISEDIWPLVSRARQPATLAAQRHQPSDLYVIELASAKELKIDGLSIQLNYLRSNYPDFFADPDRVQAFWELTAGEDRKAVEAFLNEVWSTTAEQRHAGAVLARVRLDHVTRESLRRDIQALSQILPDLIIVSHVDACKPDGSPIRSRSKFITMVSEEVRRAGLDFFDPTELMVEFGQPGAIEDDSTSLAHFTPEFSAAIMGEWMRRFVAPRMEVFDGNDARRGNMLRGQIDAACAAGEFAKATTRLAAGSPLKPSVLQAQVQAQETFLRSMKPLISPDERAGLFRKAGALGLFDLAYQLAFGTGSKIADLSTYDLVEVALLAESHGEIEVAEALALVAFGGDPRARRPMALLRQLVLRHKRDLFEALSPDDLARLQNSFSSMELLAALNESQPPVKTLVAGTMRATTLAPLVAELASQSGLGKAAAIVAHWRTQQKGARLRGAELVTLMDHWVQQSIATKVPLKRVQRLSALRLADPRHKAVRAALRDAKTDLVTRFRAAGKGKDLPALMALSKEVATLDVPLPEYDLWCARLHYEIDDFKRAIDFGQRAAEGAPAKINVWVLLMRAGVKSDNPLVARRALEQVIELASEGNAKLKTEAEETRQKLLAEA